MFCAFFFFFQAEDGIRDLVRSRGLGDVYKRQDYDQSGPPNRGDHDRGDYDRGDHDRGKHDRDGDGVKDKNDRRPNDPYRY